MLLAGVVDEDVEPAQLVDRLLDRAFAERLVADIAGDGDRLAALLLDDVLGELGVLMFAKIEDSDVRALTRKQSRHCAADAAVRPGD